MAETRNETAPDESAMSRWLMRTDRPVRAYTCLAVCLAVYAASCAFWRYAASGQWLDFRPAAFYADLTAPLGEIFRHPLDVLMYPWMILVLGLALGLLVVVPLILSVLYRPAVGSWAVLALLLLGHMPVLALAVGVGCALAGRAPFRRDSPSLAIGLGLAATILTKGGLKATHTKWSWVVGVLAAVIVAYGVIAMVGLAPDASEARFDEYKRLFAPFMP